MVPHGVGATCGRRGAAHSVRHRRGGSALNLYAVARHTGWRFRAGELLLLPGFCVALMGLAVRVGYRFLFPLFEPVLSTRMACSAALFLVIALGAAVYGLALLLSGALTREELELIPRVGPQLTSLAERWRLLR